MKKRSIFIVIGILSFYSVLISGRDCRKNLNPPPFEQLTPFAQEHQGVEVSYKALTSEESELYFDRDLLAMGFQPVHITVQNNTSDSYQVDPAMSSLPGAEASEIAMQVTKKSIPRAIGYKVASLFFWPFMIPSAIDTIHTYKAHKKMKKTLAAKALKEEKIAPYTTVHRVVYVPMEEFQEQFSIALINSATEEKLSFATLSE